MSMEIFDAAAEANHLLATAEIWAVSLHQAAFYF